MPMQPQRHIFADFDGALEMTLALIHLCVGQAGDACRLTEHLKLASMPDFFVPAGFLSYVRLKSSFTVASQIEWKVTPTDPLHLIGQNPLVLWTHYDREQARLTDADTEMLDMLEPRLRSRFYAALAVHIVTGGTPELRAEFATRGLPLIRHG